MPKRRVIVVLMATACSIAPALAQTSAPPSSAGTPRNESSLTPDPRSPAPMPTPQAQPGPFLTQANRYVRSSKLIGVPVMGADITRIGETEELLVDTTGRVAGVVIGVGGFLGIGEKRVAVPFDKLLWNYGDAARSTAPSASVTAPVNPGPAPSASANAQAMPGAQVGNDVLDAPDRRQSAAVSPATGRATDTAPGHTGAAGQAPATAPVLNPDDDPVRAVVLMSKADLENAPAFDSGDRGRTNAAGSDPASAPRR
jgi:sporulation protein YlmC with PRC-barrel domain